MDISRLDGAVDLRGEFARSVMVGRRRFWLMSVDVARQRSSQVASVNVNCGDPIEWRVCGQLVLSLVPLFGLRQKEWCQLLV